MSIVVQTKGGNTLSLNGKIESTKKTQEKITRSIIIILTIKKKCGVYLTNILYEF